MNLKRKISAICGRKHCGEKEKLLFTSDFSFSHNVFDSYIPLVRQHAALCGNGLGNVISRAEFERKSELYTTREIGENGEV